jgi:hypothetical protein
MINMQAADWSISCPLQLPIHNQHFHDISDYEFYKLF